MTSWSGTAMTQRLRGAFFAAALLCTLVLTVDDTPSVDAASASVGGWRIATSGEPWLEEIDLEALRYSYSDPPLGIAETPAGHEVVHASPGVVAASVPAYVGSSSQPSDFRIFRAGMLAALVTWLTVLLMYSALRSRLGPSLATAACGVLALGTPLWSVAADAMWPHTITALGLTGMAWAASRDRWLLAGVLGGVGLTGRLHLSAAVAVFGVSAGLAHRQWARTFMVAAGSLPFLVLAASWSRWLYGNWDPAGGYAQVDAYATVAADRTALQTLINWSGLLVSPNKGLLIWTPIVLLLLPSVVRSWGAQPTWAKSLVYGGITYTAVQGLMSVFAGGSAFYGYRLTIELLVSLTPMLAFALPHTRVRTRPLFASVAGLQVGAIGLGAAFDSPGLPIEQSWTNNAFFDLVSGIPMLAIPWLLCGLIGWLVFRAVEPRTQDGPEVPGQVHRGGLASSR